VEPFVISQELQFREEAIKRTLRQLHDDRNFDGLIDAALLLNTMWHQQTAIARWFAIEAAQNLGEAWEASRGCS